MKYQNNNAIFIGNIYGSKDGYAGAVFSINGPCPTIKANSGGNSQPMIVVRYDRTNKIR